MTEETGLAVCGSEVKLVCEKLFIEEAEKLGAAAVYFKRYFKNEESAAFKSEPLVYIFPENVDQLKVHKALWTAARADIYLIVGKTEVSFFNSRRPSGKGLPDDFNRLQLANIALKAFDARFSGFTFEKELFWGEDFSFDETKDTPFAVLSEHLENTRRALHKSHPENKDTVDKLLLVSLLIKFLEQKKDDKGRFALEKKYAQRNVKS